MTSTHTPAQPHQPPRRTLPRGRLLAALIITAVFVGIEVAAGLFANSLALLTDAAHNITDVIALGLSMFAIWLAAKPADARNTYGYHRAGILVALFNSTSLVVIALGIFYEAVRRIASPGAVQEDILIGVAALAFFVNAGTAWLVHRGSQNDLNLRAAFLHLAADAGSTLGAVVAGLVIKFTGWEVLDPLVSFLIGGLILYNGWRIIRETIDILLESTPRGIDMAHLVAHLNQIEGVQGIHDLHVWSLTSSMRALSAHVLVEDMALSDGAFIQRAINDCLATDFDIAHATLQLECAGCEPDMLFCHIPGIDEHTRAVEMHA